MYQPIRRQKETDGNDFKDNNIPNSDNNDTNTQSDVPWKNEDDRISNFYITTNSAYDYKRLPKFIKLGNCQPGEISTLVKQSFPKAARFHKKRQDTDPCRYFLS